MPAGSLTRGVGRIANASYKSRMERERKEHDEATAYHEAGHAVMALALGRPVASVSILPDRRFLGMCEFGKAVFRPSEDWLEREMLIALAGLPAPAPHPCD